MTMKILPFLLLTTLFGVVDSQAYYSPPCEGPCLVSFPQSCSELASQYIWSGECCSLTDNANNGCDLTVSSGGCTLEGRLSSCTADLISISCLGKSLQEYSSNSMEACPASEYNVTEQAVSEEQLLSGLTMNLTGISSLTEEGVSSWEQTTSDYIVDYYAESEIWDDVISYVSMIFFNSTVGEDGADKVKITYFQAITYRDTENYGFNPDFIAEDCFLDEDGVSTYVQALQANGGVLANVTGLEYPRLQEHVVYNVSMTLSGIDSLSPDEVGRWVDIVETLTTEYYQGSGIDVSSVRTIISITNGEDITANDDGMGRRLQEETSITIEYTQYIAFRTTDNSITPKYVVSQPFASEQGSMTLLEVLELEGGSFTEVTSVSPVQIPSYEPPTDSTEDGSMTDGSTGDGSMTDGSTGSDRTPVSDGEGPPPPSSESDETDGNGMSPASDTSQGSPLSAPTTATTGWAMTVLVGFAVVI